MNLHFLHGFLGLPSDWRIFSSAFHPYNLFFHSIHQFLPAQIDKRQSQFKIWVQKFNQSIFNNPQFLGQKNILIGYSLGGRLALHALLNSPLWDGGIIISANPGLSSREEKKQRLRQDKNWAKKFLTEPWNAVMDEWNRQTIFSNQTHYLIRNEVDYNRTNSANILLSFSLAKQQNLRKYMHLLKIPMLWISGENDAKFSKITKDLMNSHKNLNYQIIENAGHRVPWENPDRFIEITQKLLSNI